MAFYSDDDVAQMSDAMEEWLERAFDALTRIQIREYRQATAHEMATHGFSRRLQGLQHTMERIFELLSPNDEKPDPLTVLDVTAMLQAFVINIYGAIDNLARIWVQEAGIVGEKGRPLPASFVGFGPRHLAVRATVPAYLLAELVAADDWFGYLEDYRHALAHRVPFYIPPKILNRPEQTEFERLNDEISAAVGRRDRQSVFELQAQQSALGTFRPMIMHSFNEGAIPMRFHPQMLCDFSTTVLIAELTLRALDEPPPLASAPN
jgi:hypothetical protein